MASPFLAVILYPPLAEYLPPHLQIPSIALSPSSLSTLSSPPYSDTRIIFIAYDSSCLAALEWAKANPGRTAQQIFFHPSSTLLSPSLPTSSFPSPSSFPPLHIVGVIGDQFHPWRAVGAFSKRIAKYSRAPCTLAIHKLSRPWNQRTSRKAYRSIRKAIIPLLLQPLESLVPTSHEEGESSGRGDGSGGRGGGEVGGEGEGGDGGEGDEGERATEDEEVREEERESKVDHEEGGGKGSRGGEEGGGDLEDGEERMETEKVVLDGVEISPHSPLFTASPPPSTTPVPRSTSVAPIRHRAKSKSRSRTPNPRRHPPPLDLPPLPKKFVHYTDLPTPKTPIGSELRRFQMPWGQEVVVHFAGPTDGPLLISFHGWGLKSYARDQAHYWVRLAEAGFRVIAPDFPGHGHSKAPKRLSCRSEDSLAPGGPVAIADQVVKQVLQERNAREEASAGGGGGADGVDGGGAGGVGEGGAGESPWKGIFCVLGYSWGGASAILFTHTHRKLVSHLILHAPSFTDHHSICKTLTLPTIILQCKEDIIHYTPTIRKLAATFPKKHSVYHEIETRSRGTEDDVAPHTWEGVSDRLWSQLRPWLAAQSLPHPPSTPSVPKWGKE